MEEVHVTIRQGYDGLWRTEPQKSGYASPEDCVRALKRKHPGAALVVEVRPRLVGVTEAARILKWDRRRVATYVSRGSFPEPIASLAGGRVWAATDIEAFAHRYRTRRSRAKRK